MMAQNLDVVRHELASRIAALDLRVRSARMPELIAAVADIHALAQAAHMHAAVTVLHFIAAALARGERGASVHGWLPVLRDAVRTERQDPLACDAFAAVCSVRLAA